MIRVVVLGCGPAGLLAAHAASLHGADVMIFSVKKQSPISGAQYLHRSIPGLNAEPDGFITYMKSGERDGYAKKVYGIKDIDVSWDLWESAVTTPAWSMQKAYQTLWDMYEQGIYNYKVKTPVDIHNLENLGADLYITSLPAPATCEGHGNHFFESVEMWIAGGLAPGVQVPYNTIVYNGHESMPWHRASSLFGHESMEYGSRPDNGAKWIFHGLKPVRHNCDCNPKWLRVGRFGQWKKGVLVHHAYEEVERALQQM